MKIFLRLLLILELIALITLAVCYDGSGDLGELYFNFGDRLFYVGFME